MSSPASELKSELVRAGAGAGKTRGLVNTVVEVFRHFQARGEQPRIVLTTFTRKATQELKERLILRACSDRDAALLQFVSDPGRLQISTIHGLLNLFLRQVGHLAGIDAGFQLISEAEGDHLARQVLRDVLVEHPEGLRWLETYGFDRVLQMCRRFDGAARGAAYMGESPGLEPAGMEDLQAAADRVIASWRERLRQLVHEFEAGTDDRGWLSFAAGINDFVARWSGDGAELGELPTKPRRSKKCEHLEPLHERYDDVVKEFKTEMGRTCWNRNLWPDMVASWREFAGLGRAFAHKMATLKEGQARFEMEDLELKSMEVLRAQPFLGSVFAANWDFWMIDEYQDTSPLQVACLKALMAAQPRYFVGDPQQSIYLFRGAEVSVFSATEEELKASGAAIRELRRNYRSEPDLLLWINDFMSSLGAGFAHMDPREDPAPPTRSCVTFFKAEDADQELKAIVTRVQELVRNGVGLERICVLGRTHRNLVEVSRALRNFGYPTHVHAARGFGQRREVLDARALWKFLVNPHDNSNLIQLLRSPWFFIEDYRIEEWMADKPRSLWCKLLSIEESTDSVIRLCRAQDQVAQLGLVRAFEESLCAAAYVDLSLVNDPAGRKESNLWKLILRAHTLEKDGGSVLDLLEDDGSDPMDSQEGDAASAQEPNCINLMTIHGSKGLEFDHVILPRMGESPRTSHTPPLETDGGRFFFPVWDKG
ncbi:MAG: UvrD-helicase domain-containing protein, partial [Bdellovibrionales bacterium]